MKRNEYLKLRSKMYKVAGEVGTFAEIAKFTALNVAYDKMCQSLDEIDLLGVGLGYIDPETNDVLRKKGK